MKRFLQIVAKTLSVTAPLATFTGVLLVPKYIASFPAGSPMFWFGLALAVSAIAAAYVGLYGWSVVDRIYAHYAAITYHEVFRRGQLPLRAQIWSIALGFCAVVVSFFWDAAMPPLFYALAVPACTVSLVCVVQTGVAFLWMYLVDRSYDGYISYAYEIFNSQTGAREPRQDTCHIREVDDLIIKACLDFLEEQRKYEIFQDELLEAAFARAFYKATTTTATTANASTATATATTTTTTSEPQDDDH